MHDSPLGSLVLSCSKLAASLSAQGRCHSAGPFHSSHLNVSFQAACGCEYMQVYLRPLMGDEGQ